MTATRELKRVDADRWVYRTGKGDFGPVTTDGILQAMVERKVDLGTMVSVLGSNKWQAAGELAIFRDHYQVCKAKWDREEREREAEAVGRKLEAKHRTSRRAWLLIAVGAVVGLGAVAWVVWRLSLASPTGLMQIAALAAPPPLPAPQRLAAKASILPVPSERKVARLAEPESYDTAGVAIGDAEGGHVTQMHFDESGEVQAISQEDLARVVGAARAGLFACAQEAATRSASFRGTEVGFSVAPGRLVKIAVGQEARGNPAFLACVKAALGRVQVPAFSGSERRVTMPLRIER